MFGFLLFKNTKTILTVPYFLPKMLRIDSQRHKSSLQKKLKSKLQPTKSKNMYKTTDEVFFPSMKNEGITNKIALVTGGTEGIGLRCVKELLKGGAKGVMIADSDEAKGYDRVKEFSKLFGRDRVAFVQVTPSNYHLLKNAFLSTIQYYRSLDIVVNSIKFKERNWEDQVDEDVKSVVLSAQLCLEFMGRNNGGNGGILLNIASDYDEKSESCPLHQAVQDFIVRFDRSVASAHFGCSNVKILTICKATFDSIGGVLPTIISRGPNGCVWKPS